MIINNSHGLRLELILFAFVVLVNNCTMKQKLQVVDDYYVNSENQENTSLLKKEELPFEQKIFSKDFKSLTFSSRSLILGEPLYNMNSKIPIIINFDLLRNHGESIQYEIIHCNKDWKKSDILTMDAIDGFDIDYIENQEISYGPVQQYINYNFELPNDNTDFLVSGNYLIKVFIEGKSESPLATLKFYVSEQISTINFTIDKSKDVEQSKYLQAFEMECTYNSSDIVDPYENIYINIQQNHQEFNQYWLSGPNFIKENKLVFLPSEDQIFNGGNEFRFFDMSSFRNGSQRIENINFNDSIFNVNLKKDVRRSYKQYLQYKDMNGRFFIRTYDFDDANSQAEYGMVNFRLPMKQFNSDSIYIFGQLTNWTIDSDFLMTYDTINNYYQNKSLLKQGYYNYIYVVKNNSGFSTRKIEGAHFESNNEYILKMYYKDPVNLLDRILSYKVVKSN